MPEKPSILILEDNQLDIKILQRLLHSYELSFVGTQQSAIAHAQEQLPDLVIVDGMSPDASGHALCQALKRVHLTAKIPVLFMYTAITAEEITQMFHSGGADYINKPFNQVELLSRVHVHILSNTQRKELELLAMYDPMTMCYNRRVFFELAHKEMELTHTQGTGLSLMLFDIVSFDTINKEYGHFAGDTVLKEFAKVLRSILPKDAIFGRLGGKDFAVVIVGSTLEEDTYTAEACANVVGNIDVHGAKIVEVQYALSRRLSIEDTVDSVLLRTAEKMKNCYVVRTSRNY